MGTPSEVAAGIILDKLGFEGVKFVNGALDYIATKDGDKAVIEVKSAGQIKPNQMMAFAKEVSFGNQAFLLIVSEDAKYCLFKLVSTNLASSKEETHIRTLTLNPKRMRFMGMGISPSELVPSEIRSKISNFLKSRKHQRSRRKG